mmetsp:Transcript_19221/g.17039  ORF Transcript_19221/g.17039 Transcript_19221/m.17039 type:complete len:98 (+) Transcript_19221:70-363(+)
MLLRHFLKNKKILLQNFESSISIYKKYNIDPFLAFEILKELTPEMICFFFILRNFKSKYMQNEIRQNYAHLWDLVSGKEDFAPKFQNICFFIITLLQ